MHCGEGNEERIAEVLKVQFSERAEISLFTYEKMKRYQGEWHVKTEFLFQGYVFLYAPKKLVLDEEEKRYLIAVEKPEDRQLSELRKWGEHVPMSKGYIKEGVTFVTEGPLKGKETTICKIDRHKRLAKVKSPLEKYRERGLWAGLEIVSKN